MVGSAGLDGVYVEKAEDSEVIVLDKEVVVEVVVEDVREDDINVAEPEPVAGVLDAVDSPGILDQMEL